MSPQHYVCHSNWENFPSHIMSPQHFVYHSTWENFPPQSLSWNLHCGSLRKTFSTYIMVCVPFSLKSQQSICVIWHYGCWWTLPQVMAWCLMTAATTSNRTGLSSYDTGLILRPQQNGSQFADNISDVICKLSAILFRPQYAESGDVSREQFWLCCGQAPTEIRK